MVDLSRVPEVDQVDAATFQTEYKRPARPVIIRRLTESWPAREKWTVEHLKQRAGEVVVPLYDSQPSRDHKHQHAPAARMPLGEYMELLENGENDLRLFFFNFFNTIPDLTEDFQYPELGLKFFRKLPVLFMGGKGSRVQLHFDIDLADI